MRASWLDRRVRAEAAALVRQASIALRSKRDLHGREAVVEAVVAEVSRALAARDYRAVRAALPRLDALVDDLSRGQPRPLREYIEPLASAFLIALALRTILFAPFEIPSSSMYPTVEINDFILANTVAYGIKIPFTTKRVIPWRKPARGEVIVFIQPCQPDRDYIKRVIATEGQSVEVRCNVVYVDGVPLEQTLVGQCSYEDQHEGSSQWFTRPCSEYVEHGPGGDYHTYHNADRPARDHRNAPDDALAQPDGNDFPRLDWLRLPPSCSRNPDGSSFASPNQLPGELVETRHTAGACEPQLHYVVPPGHLFVMGDNRANSRDSRYFGSVPVENVHGKALLIWLSYRNWDPLHWGGVRWKRLGSLVE